MGAARRPVAQGFCPSPAAAPPIYPARLKHSAMSSAQVPKKKSKKVICKEGFRWEGPERPAWHALVSSGSAASSDDSVFVVPLASAGKTSASAPSASSVRAVGELGSLPRTRADHPVAPHPDAKRQRGSLAGARAVLCDPSRKAAAVEALRADFTAASNGASKSNKRSTVEELAMLAAGSSPSIYPLTEEIVEGVAAALKSSRFKSATTYLDELRLGHIEARHDIPLWLARLLLLCKRSVSRGIGPPDKAAELKFEHMVPGAASLQGPNPGDVSAPFRAYVVANRWLEREIEVSAHRLAHVTLHLEERVAELRLPVSKNDSGGAGTSRKLRCTCGAGWASPPGVPDATCPFHVLQEQVAAVVASSGVQAHEHAAWLTPLFPTVSGDTATKAAMIAGWQMLVPPDHVAVGGHSARRSGAKRYAREGWGELAIRNLGRWASAAVLGYIEEAYSEMVGSASYGTAEATAVPALEARIAALEGLIDQVRSQLPSSTRALATEADTALLETPPAEPELVLVRGTNRHAKAIHIRASCAAGQPSDAWRTRCGWAFTAAYAFEEVALDEAVRAPSEKCPRCWKARDAAEP